MTSEELRERWVLAKRRGGLRHAQWRTSPGYRRAIVGLSRRRGSTWRLRGARAHRPGLRFGGRPGSVARAWLVGVRQRPLVGRVTWHAGLDRAEDSALVVGDHEEELEAAERRRGLEEHGLDDLVRLDRHVDDPPDEQALRVRRTEPATELDPGCEDLFATRHRRGGVDVRHDECI